MEDRLCDNCKRPPELMHTDECKEFWFFVISKNQDDPIALVWGKEAMPEFKFTICLERNPIMRDGEQAICGKCLEAIYPE